MSGAPHEDHEPRDAAARDLWRRQQRRYWDEISNGYDALYENYWSRRENAWVRSRLSFIRDLTTPTVVDLGCGTGLGWHIVKSLNPHACYIGLDISPAMVKGLGDKIDKGDRIHIGSMEDIEFMGSNEADVVISLFSSVSYARQTEAVFAEISRVLAVGGYAYVSLLSSQALSRVRTRVGSDRYRTRGDHRIDATVPARKQTVDTIQVLAENAGLRPQWMTGMNIFSGIAEVPRLWTLGRLGARFAPNRAHTIEALLRHAKKVPE